MDFECFDLVLRQPRGNGKVCRHVTGVNVLQALEDMQSAYAQGVNSAMAQGRENIDTLRTQTILQVQAACVQLNARLVSQPSPEWVHSVIRTRGMSWATIRRSKW